MTYRATRLFATAAAVLIALPLSGCSIPGSVDILISDFDSAHVEGVWIWREAEGGGGFERMTEIQLGEAYLNENQEFVNYALVDSTGQQLALIPTPLKRTAGQQGSVELRLFVAPDEFPCAVKASTYNQLGESALSSETLRLSL